MVPFKSLCENINVVMPEQKTFFLISQFVVEAAVFIIIIIIIIIITIIVVVVNVKQLSLMNLES